MSTSPPPIPSAAADRIIRNPHSLPRVPAQLTEIINVNRHNERHRQHAEQAYFIRRAKIESERIRRMHAARLMQTSRVEITPSPPSSPVMTTTFGPIGLAAARLSPIMTSFSPQRPPMSSFSSFGPPMSSSPVGLGLGPLARSKSFDQNNNGAPPPRPRSKSMSQSVHILSRPNFNRRRSVIEAGYDTPFSSRNALFDIPDGSIFESVGRSRRRHSVDQAPHISVLQHLYHLPAYSKNPEVRAKQRMRFSKRPNPSWKAHQSNKDIGHAWISHPSWHRMMRSEYQFHGLEDIWRDERNRFMQDFRRERQFEKQSQYRRMSSMF
ncbi:hypothetical protein TRVA0_053S00496 [Trichomonascus vanleenenianus]|uniref:uncharacterized protein n=1 Tax=Trichomonascus vanleenenianus TaxID=2268995 RepID=UPI003ECABB07